MGHRVIFCGSRHWTDEAVIGWYIDRLPADTVVLQGGARGADAIAKRLAEARGLPVEDFVAEWGRLGFKAGPVRNRRMLESGVDAVYAFRLPGHSPGTDDMVRIARAAHVSVVMIGPGRRT